MAVADWVHQDYRSPNYREKLSVQEIKDAAERLGRTVVFRCHLSGHHSTGPLVMARYIRGAVDEGMDIVSTTESNRKMKEATEDALGPYWQVHRRGEYLVIWDDDMFKEAKGYIKYHRITHVYKIQIWRDLRTHCRKLQHLETKRWYRTDVGHLPAATQKGKKFNELSNPEGVRAWKSGLNRQGRRMQGRPNGLLQDFVADFNVDLDEEVWRNEVENRLGYPTIYEKYVPDWATHRGDRLIDGAAGNQKVVAIGNLNTKVPDSIDHGNFWYAFEI